MKREPPRRSTTGIKTDLPPLCPKCGSHRTRVVGTVKQSALHRVLCLLCGNTSQLLTDRPK